MTRVWCHWSNRVLPGYEWWDHRRTACPSCGRRVPLVAGRLRKHHLPAVGAST